MATDDWKGASRLVKIGNRQSAIGNFSSALIVKPSSLGDVVHTLPSVHLLKKARPDLRITWLVNSEWSPLLAGNSDIERVLEFPRSRFHGVNGLLNMWKWWKMAAWNAPDLALDFQGLARSAVLARLSGARRIHCLGDAELIPRLLSHRVVPSKRGVHAVERYLRLVADLEIVIERPLEFPLPPGEKPPGFDLQKPYLLVHPFSRGKDKSLAEADLMRLCERLHPVPIVAVGKSSNQIRLPPDCVNLLNHTSLLELIWLIRHAHFTFSVDSGPMHIAAAITPNLLGLHTWTNPQRVGPCNSEAWIWKGGEIMQMKSFDANILKSATSLRAEHLAKIAEFLQARF